MDLQQLLEEIRPYAERYWELNNARIEIKERLPFAIDEHVTTTQARRVMDEEIRKNLECITHEAAKIVIANRDALEGENDNEHLCSVREYLKTFDNLGKVDSVIYSTLRKWSSFETPPELDSVRHAAEMYTMDVRKHCEEAMLAHLHTYITRNM